MRWPGALSGQDGAVFCLGAYTGAVPDAELRRITVDYTIEFARVLRAGSPNATFALLSGSGANPTGRSRMAFARYKGEAEKALAAAGFPHVYMFRPAYIYPVQPRREPIFSYRLLRTIYPAFRVLFPNQVIRADDLARTMVDAAVTGSGEAAIWFWRTVTSSVGRRGVFPALKGARPRSATRALMHGRELQRLSEVCIQISDMLVRPHRGKFLTQTALTGGLITPRSAAGCEFRPKHPSEERTTRTEALSVHCARWPRVIKGTRPRAIP